MNKLPQTATVSDIRHRHLDVISKAKESPVMLSSKGKPVAVIVSPEQWNKIAERLEDLDDLVTGLEGLLELERGENSTTPIDEAGLRALIGNSVPT